MHRFHDVKKGVFSVFATLELLGMIYAGITVQHPVVATKTQNKRPLKAERRKHP